MRRCAKCGAKLRRDCKSDTCKACRDKDDRSFQTTLRGRGRPVRFGGTAVCKMPHCHRRYKLAHNQDPRYTWYCPKCRAEIAEITTGVLWLESWGIILAPTENILEDSLAKAYDDEEVKHKKTVRQKTGGAGDPSNAFDAEEEGEVFAD